MADDTGSRPGPVALVTGARGGLGAAISARLLQDGIAVMRADLPGPRWPPADEPAPRDGAASTATALDVCDEGSAAAAVAATRERLGSVDILINCAGLVQLGSADELSLDDWRRVLDVNLTGTFIMCMAVRRAMLAAGVGGAIVNLGSVSGRTQSVNGAPNYVASKAGVIGLTMSLARQWAPDGIRVNCVAPGGVDAGMADEYEPAQRAALRAAIPLGRFATAEEVAEATLFLATSRSSFTTGETLNVNGGQFMV
jgi:NAD(P)-dependent dehydrogenase (short-subunit alcohol dehydrogenase family)